MGFADGKGDNMKTFTMYENATKYINDLYETYETSYNGLYEEDVKKRREKYGENIVHSEKKTSISEEIIDIFKDPFTLVLIVLGVILFIAEYLLAENGQKDLTSPLIIFTLVIIGATMNFIQNRKGNKALKALQNIVKIKTTVKRNGTYKEINTRNLVVGDIIALKAGDRIPADIRLIETKDLFISQASLTGESYPVEKKALGIVKKGENPLTFETICYGGSDVVSGTATAIIVKVGKNTLFGKIAKEMEETETKTEFDKGIMKTSHLLVKFMLVTAPLVILINIINKGNIFESVIFGVSVAVGLTPEMLPTIVTANLVKGAKDFMEKKTAVRNISAMQNFGAIDVLCTDKTGTLTQDRTILENTYDTHGNESEKVLKYAYANSSYQTGLSNIIDKAVKEKAQEKNIEIKKYRKIDEIPFDFARRRMTVVIKDENKKTYMITKGAIEELLEISDYIEENGKITKNDEKKKEEIQKRVNELNKKGYRILGLAIKKYEKNLDEYTKEEEKEMTFIGYLSLFDPPKESAKNAIKSLHEYGVDVKILTGDNKEVTMHICKEVGLDENKIITGEELIGKKDEEISHIVEENTAFVKLTPMQKSLIVKTLRKNGHTVGYMGDGINDAAAMRSADISISVDNAVDIAKDSADIVFLHKDLLVLKNGIIKGREVFGNTMKYIKITIASNFGNILSILAASIFLPFLPMTPLQILTLNLIYDIICTAIPYDTIDEEYTHTPKKWETKSIKDFTLKFGPASSIFDIITFATLYYLIIPTFMKMTYTQISGIDAMQFENMFRTGWFIISLWTQTLIIYVLRSEKKITLKKIPSIGLFIFTTAGLVIGTALPFTQIGNILGMATPPKEIWILLLAIIVLYTLCVEKIKEKYIKKHEKLL